MQFYSDISSEEEIDDEDEMDLWNPNELIDEILSIENEEEKLKLKKALLHKFLEQERPLLTSKMREFFLEDGVTESLMSFVARLKDVDVNAEKNEVSNENKRKSIFINPRPLNIPGEEDDVKRSFNVMEIFLNPMHDLDSFLPEKLHVILKEIFKIFSPNSNGNFHHFNKIMEQLLGRCPSATTKILISENLLWTMLDYLHETPVTDILVEIFCVGFPRQSDTIQFYKSLVDNKMFEKIGEKLFGKPSIGASYVGDFFIRLMEKLSSIEMSGILFISLCRTPTFIDGLFNTLSKESEFPFTQRQACANVLRELLLKSGQKVFEHVDFTKPLPNMLSAIHDKLHDYAKLHVEEVCNILINMHGRSSDQPLELQSYSIKRPFGFYKLALTDILSDLVVCAPEMLDKLSSTTWKVLSAWFLEYKYNNLYHFHFWKLYQLSIRDNHLESQKALFGKHKFLTKMIEQYSSTEPSGSRGFIIVMCNTLRLAADLQPQGGYLRHYLNSHDLWKQFLNQLREDTLLQQKKYDDLIYMPDMMEDELEEDLGIDLGSAYARSLGFEENEGAQIPESPSKTRKKKAKKNKKKKLVASTEGTLLETSEESSGSESDASESDANAGGDWWKDMVEDLKHDEVKEEEPKEDWWKELKEELHTMESSSTTEVK